MLEYIRLWAIIQETLYNWYIGGETINGIAARLTEAGVSTPAGKSKWSVSTVRSILSNEKYKGEALLQKTYTTDYLTKEVRKNTGEVPFILVRNSHEAIIEPQLFERVQELLSAQPKRRSSIRTNHPFAGKLICSRCGATFGHKVWRLRSTGEHYDVWYCNHRYNGDEPCDTPHLRENEIKTAFEQLLKQRGEDDPAYSASRWREIVQSVTVYPDRRLRFALKDAGEGVVAL